MRIFVTGAIGFVGRWLERELVANGHEVVAAPGPDELDITDRSGLVRWLGDPAALPDAVIHLAGMAFAPDARQDPAEAFRVNVGGTVALFEALREIGIRPPVMVSGSSDAYGVPRPQDLPLREDAPLAPHAPYALSKAAQEGGGVERGIPQHEQREVDDARVDPVLLQIGRHAGEAHGVHLEDGRGGDEVAHRSVDD